MRLAVAFVLLLTGAVLPSGQQQQSRDAVRIVFQGSGQVIGTVVVEGPERTPARRAIVTLSRQGIEDIRTTAADDKGQFSFRELPAGSFTLSAAKAGYIGVSLGAPKPGMPGRAIVLTDGGTYDAPPMALIRGAVIAGRILDRSGQPVAAAQVQATQFITVDGQRRRRTTGGSSGSAVTNEHGEYRIYGLLAGDYLVFSEATVNPQVDTLPAELAWARKPETQAPPPARPYSRAPTLFPGVSSEASAGVVAVTAGEERLGVDFVLQYVPVAKLSGVVLGVDGLPLPGVRIERFARLPSGILAQQPMATNTSADGTFVMSGVPPGEWLLTSRVTPMAPNESARIAELARMGLVTAAASSSGPVVALFGQTEVSIGGSDRSGISIALQPAANVTGEFAAKGNAPAPDFSRFSVRLVPVGASGQWARALTTAPDPTGRFRIPSAPPGLYRVATGAVTTPGATGSWLVKSAMLGNQDVIDVPFEIRLGEDVSGLTITLTDAPSEIAGSITDASGTPISQLYVLVFSVDRSHWDYPSRRAGFVRASDAGTYSIRALPPGEYHLVALTELDTTRVSTDPSYFEELAPASIKLTLGEGEKKSQDLRVNR